MTDVSEIEELRAQLEVLQARVKRGAQRFSGDASSDAGSPLEQAREFAQEWNLPEASQKLAEFLGGLGEDIKESKPRALVSAFLAGFIAGKVLGR